MRSRSFSPLGPYGREFGERCLIALCFGVWRCLLGILGSLGLSFRWLFSLSRMGHYGQSRTPKTGTVHRTTQPYHFYEIFLLESLVESKYCCNFAIEFRKRLDMSLILNRNRESSVIPSYVSTEMLCG